MRDVIEMAREVKMPYDFVTGEPINIEKLKAFAALVEAAARADEREEFQRWFEAVTVQHKQLILAEKEACAKVADLVAREMDDTNGIATYIGKLIRNRGNT
jgi:hypothetical protein